ncbi:peptidoglycan-binding protein [Terrabacter sp. NPDC000476]|uniref:peptidoglycan recognition protein family protein n=1 Tax=Terrabacter sp. NPDC000476 TaxID=3154258 RepID=UPI0033206B87
MGRRRLLRLVTVDPALSRRSLLAGALGVGAVGGLGVAKATPSNAAVAAVARPAIASCAAWGAQPATGTVGMTGPPQRILVHHTASANTIDHSQAAAYSLARNIQSWHFARGWIDSGQQFTISRGGFTMEGRHRSVEGLGSGSSTVFPLGAHCTGQNSTSIGIENEGTYTSALPTSAQWDALVALCAYLCQTYGLGPADIYGHRDFLDTECPGDALYAKLPQLRADVATRLGTSNPPPPPTRTWPTLKQGSSGFRVTAAQHLLRHSGRSVTADGAFGAGTAAAVVSFQQAKGLTADGVVGRATWESPLAVTCRQGQTSDAVRGVQSALTAQGYAVTVDGVFGAGTASATKAFQTAHALDADAVVGPNTWSRLLA